MGLMSELNLKPGVIYGDDVLRLFQYAQKHQFAIPAINVTSSSTVVAALEAAREKKSPIILQTSQGGAAYFAGKGIPNGNQEASVAGAVAAAHYIRSIAPVYGIPGEKSLKTAKALRILTLMKLYYIPITVQRSFYLGLMEW
jgi:fructose-bisphosphate aldolase, class II